MNEKLFFKICLGQYSCRLAISKKDGANKSSQFRLINLMRHVLKIDSLCTSRYKGNVNKRKPRKNLASVSVLVLEKLQSLSRFQNSRDQSHVAYLFFIIHENAFHWSRNAQLIHLYHNQALVNKDINLIKNKYWRQSASIKVGENTNMVHIKRGAYQGYRLSPLLHNLYSEKVF